MPQWGGNHGEGVREREAAGCEVGDGVMGGGGGDVGEKERHTDKDNQNVRPGREIM